MSKIVRFVLVVTFALMGSLTLTDLPAKAFMSPTIGTSSSTPFVSDIIESGSPTMPSITFPAGWNQISFAIQPMNSNPEAVFNMDSQELAAASLTRYDPTILSYVAYDEFNPSEFGDIKAGEGYWIRFDESKTVEYEAALSTNQTVDLNQPGWHMIGIPQSDKCNLGALKFYKGSTKNFKNFNEAIQSNWIEQPLLTYDAINPVYHEISLSGDHKMLPWYGYWFYTNVPNLVLKVQ